MLVATFWEKPFAGPLGNWWCLSCWCLGGLSIVFRWSLVSCGILVVCPWLSWGCSVICFAMFCSYLGGVSVVSRRCYGGGFGGIEGMAFSWLSWITSQDNIVAKGNAKLCYWGSMPA